MNNPIVDRLLKSRSSMKLKESMSLFEAEADEEYKELNNDYEDNEEDLDTTEDPGVEDTEGSEDNPEVEDDSTAPEQGSPDDAPPSPSSSGSLPDFKVPEEDAVPPEEEVIGKPEEENEKYENPLDNQYAVYHTLGDDIALSFEGDAQNTREGIIDGYDPEGFYRVRWADGTTTNGLTDIALEGLVKKTNECVCGGTHFINEGNRTVCDKCGRIHEGATLLQADKDRPKGKKLIRSEAHPMSTATKPNITESEKPSDSFELKCDSCGTTSTYTDKDISKHFYPNKLSVRCKHPNCGNHIVVHDNKSIKDRIKEAFMKSRVNEIHEDYDEEGSVFDKLKQNLDNEFWTRQNELVEDIEELGFIVEEINGEYVIVSHDEDEDNAYQIFLGGTSRTFTLDFNRARIV